MLKEHSGKGRVLDLGCCMGTDLRQMILDGLCDVQSAIGIDLEDSFIQEGARREYTAGIVSAFACKHARSADPLPSFFALFLTVSGMRMFGDGTGKWPANALAAADVFNKASWPASITEAQFRVVYSGALFHLFEQPKQAALAATVFTDLLEPGGCFFGRHVISAEAASFTVVPENDAVSQLRYLPNRDDFSLMMESAGFTDVRLMFAPADMTRTTMEYGGKAKQYLSFVATKR